MRTDITLSICSGTINRLASLKRMIQTVRETVPETMRYEFVLADNGSTDGTPEWIEQQPDCRLIQEGKPVGGVRALTDAAFAATGKYVMISTDDTGFPPYSIVRAISYLETHPTCGAVQFEDYVSSMEGYDEQYVWDKDGKLMKVIYPQLSIVRKWLGDACDWWGANTLMKNCWTYAGDNHLGYQINMRGYTTDRVPGCDCICYLIEDSARKYQTGVNPIDRRTRVAAYGSPKSPNPEVMYPGAPTVPNPDKEELRILFVNDYIRMVPNWRTAKPAFVNAVADCGIVWEHLYKDDPEAADKLYRAAGALQPHLILSNIHQYELFSYEDIKRIRQAAPGAIWLNWIGDVWPQYHTNVQWTDVWKAMSGLLIVNAGMLTKTRKQGIPSFYWQAGPEEYDELPEMPAHDVVFQGNGHRRAQKCGQRAKLGAALHELTAEGIDVGIYAARGFEAFRNGDTFWKFNQTQALNRNAKLVVSDNEFCASGYVSKRFFDIIITGGGMCLHQKTRLFDKLNGLKEGKHYIAWTDYHDLQAKIRYWLDPKQDKRRQQIAANAREVALERHTYPARMRELLTEIIPQLAKEKTGG
jgi:glycosyltransferase involved in cell wall biosynthesis